MFAILVATAISLSVLGRAILRAQPVPRQAVDRRDRG